MDRLGTYEMFIAVAEQGSFAGAARRLGISPPALSRGIAELEARLGVSLFHRSTRAVSLTDQGTALLPRAQRLLAELTDAERAAAGNKAEPRGQLHLTAPVAFGRLHVLPVVTDLLDRHPALEVRMMLIDRNVRTIEEGIDVAVRIGALGDSALKSVQIGSVRQVIAASPAYLARHGMPQNPDQLARHQLIASTGPRAATEWRFAERKEAPGKPRLHINTVEAALAATEAGAGIASFLSYQVAEAISSGRLIEVLRPAAPQEMPVSLLFEASRANLPAARAFIETMKARGRDGRWN